MHDVIIILQREFLVRVRTKSFLIGTVLFPLILAAVVVLPTIVGSGSVHRIVVLEEAFSGFTDRFVKALSQEEHVNRYAVERLQGTLQALGPELNRRVLAREIDGYVVIQRNVLDESVILYRARSISSLGVAQDLTESASRAVQEQRLVNAGLEAGALAAAMRPITIDTARVTIKGEERGTANASFIFAYLIAFMVFFPIQAHGVSVTASVLEEKTSRIFELLMCSTRPTALILGKILGPMLVAILQLLLWLLLIPLVQYLAGLMLSAMDMPPTSLALPLDAWTGIAIMTFFVLGFVLYAAIFAVLGAAVTNEQEAQPIQMLIVLACAAPLLSVFALTNNPLGPSAKLLGLIPLTAPVAMPIRVASGAIPLSQVLVSIALLIAFIALITWAAGRIYKMGGLRTEQRASLSDLANWLKGT